MRTRLTLSALVLMVILLAPITACMREPVECVHTRQQPHRARWHGQRVPMPVAIGTTQTSAAGPSSFL